ncbi:MAG: PA4780 family RIO1-like protein kinase, partial [Myxococcota bacterium]|nr:PA4780 family RIO1-like protein kinase [Myxococcota bacterium]
MGHRERLTALLDIGVIDEVVRPLMSGKEADVFLVVAGGEPRVAKLYKEATTRSFKHRAEYTEGRRTKNTRQQRAMSRRSRYGREQEEAAWRSAEVDAIYRLKAAGVRVPEPYDFVDGILIMELIADEDGQPAPRLVDVTLNRQEAEATHLQLVREITRMLCAGLVHGDLSDFNVLMTPSGPVVIDFPQAVDAATNNNARRMLLRDVRNVTSFLARFSPRLKKTRYGEEMWGLYEQGKLQPDTELTGKWEKKKRGVDLMGILDEIYAAEVEERRRRDALGLEPLPDKRPPPEQSRSRGRGRGGKRPPGNGGGADRARDRGRRSTGDAHPDDRGPRRNDRGPRRNDRAPRRNDRDPRRHDHGARRNDRDPRHDERGRHRTERGRGRPDPAPNADRRPHVRAEEASDSRQRRRHPGDATAGG